MANLSQYVLGAVLEDARALYKDMHAEDDFNEVIRTPTGLRFGTENHVHWIPATGFHPDRTNCTRNFLDRWDQWDL